jgi:hypothetical protein
LRGSRAARIESLCQGSNLDNGLRKPVPESVRTERGKGITSKQEAREERRQKREKMGVPGGI